jgi:hypothetical protein
MWALRGAVGCFLGGRAVGNTTSWDIKFKPVIKDTKSLS